MAKAAAQEGGYPPGLTYEMTTYWSDPSGTLVPGETKRYK